MNESPATHELFGRASALMLSRPILLSSQVKNYQL
jgi:hypothetical protein